MGLAATDVSDIKQPDMEGLAFYVLEILHILYQLIKLLGIATLLLFPFYDLFRDVLYVSYLC